MRTAALLLAGLAGAALTSGCDARAGGGAAQGVSVDLQPLDVQVARGGKVTFAAAVTGAIDTGVTWSVSEATGGTVDASGHYTAPAAAGTFHVVATSRAAPAVSAAATVTVVVSTPTVTVSLSPPSANASVGGTVQFTATVGGTSNSTVSWTVQEGAAGGAVDSTGRYTAPSTPGTYHVVATSQADTNAKASAPVTVTAAGSLATPMPLISRNAATRLYSSTGTPSATAYWRSSGYPAWYAWDFTAVPGAKTQMLLGWYNNSSDYDRAVRGAAYNLPGAFVIEAHAQAGGSVPASGWVTLASVTGNRLKSRTFILNTQGYNWVRFRATAESPDNQPQNHDCAGYFDLHDLSSSGNSNSWAFLGDSIISLYLDHGASDAFGAQIQAAAGQVPAYENCGIGFDKMTDGASRLTTVLANTVGRFVVIAYGMNDASNGEPPDQSYSTQLRQAIQRVLDSGRVPVVPTVPATNDPSHNAGLGDPLDASRPNRINRQIYVLRNAMRAEGKQVIDGPDFWAYFSAHLSEMGAGTDVHPRGAGATSYKKLWADTMLGSVYGVAR